MSRSSEVPSRSQRFAAYAVIVRGDAVLLSRLAPSISAVEMWTLPGGGIEFGEAPHRTVVREVREETGLDCTPGEPFWIGSAHRVVERDGRPVELHSVRIVYDAWVPADAPEPRVLEVAGSTVDAGWWPVADVLSGRVPTVTTVREALAAYLPARRQRVAAYALVLRGGDVLLTRNSGRGPHPGAWTLPGGGVEHGESPDAAVVREVREETGLDATVGELLGVHDEHFTGTAPSGREEDFHGLALVYAATVSSGAPVVADPEGTTDEAAWVPLEESRDRELSGLGRWALERVPTDST